MTASVRAGKGEKKESTIRGSVHVRFIVFWFLGFWVLLLARAEARTGDLSNREKPHAEERSKHGHP